MRYAVRSRQLAEALEKYAYPFPFYRHLQEYFRQNKQMGSKDRRQLRNLAYNYLRLFNLTKSLPFEQKVAIAGVYSDEFSKEDAGLNQDIKTVDDLFSFIPDKKPEDIFPAKDELNEAFKNDAFYLSHLKQPAVWIRVYEGREKAVADEFAKQNIPFTKWAERTWQIPQDAKLDNLESFRRGFFRIQDLTSQKTTDYFNPKKGEYWWDACSGAGGKTLALLEKEPQLNMYNSDSRRSILDELSSRLKIYGYKHHHIFQADLTKEDDTPSLPKFDGVIVDAPCSGSGTWARNPENLVYFDEKNIERFSALQLSILRNAFIHLKKDKPLIYITCSVYSKENEGVISQFVQQAECEIADQEYLKGFDTGAENMFICKLIKRS